MPKTLAYEWLSEQNELTPFSENLTVFEVVLLCNQYVLERSETGSYGSVIARHLRSHQFLNTELVPRTDSCEDYEVPPAFGSPRPFRLAPM